MTTDERSNAALAKYAAKYLSPTAAVPPHASAFDERRELAIHRIAATLGTAIACPTEPELHKCAAAIVAELMALLGESTEQRRRNR